MSELDRDSSNITNKMKRAQIVSEINTNENKIRQGQRIWAKEDKLKYDDKPTSYFFNKEKNRGLQKNYT